MHLTQGCISIKLWPLRKRKLIEAKANFNLLRISYLTVLQVSFPAFNYNSQFNLGLTFELAIDGQKIG